MRVLFTGGRDFICWDTIATGLSVAAEQYGPDAQAATLVVGRGRGADRVAEAIATAWGWEIDPHPAHWHRRGRAAGPERNQRMVDSGADVCVRVPGGDGTDGCEAKARAAGIPVLRINAPMDGRITLLH